MLHGKKYTALTLIHAEKVHQAIELKNKAQKKIHVFLRRDVKHVHPLRPAVSIGGMDVYKPCVLSPVRYVRAREWKETIRPGIASGLITSIETESYPSRYRASDESSYRT